MGDMCSVRSCARSCIESGKLEVALQRLCAKLKASQPVFTEDDAAVINFLSDSASSSTRPLSNPERLTNLCEVEDTTIGQVDFSKNREMYSLSLNKSEELAAKQLSSSSQLDCTNISSIRASPNGIINLDSPLSVGLFLTAVNIFEPKLITKSRKNAHDAVKLIKQGYALAYEDPHFAFPSGVRTRTHSPVPDSIIFIPVEESVIPKRKLLVGSSCVVNTTASPEPYYKPDPALISYLDQSVQALLVYCNDSVALTQFITSNQTILRLFSTVCSMARHADKGSVDVAKRALGERDVNAELEELRSLWSSYGLAGRVINYLQECYLIEFLLDDALPPAVCSSRYEGLINALHDKKHKITLDMLMSRHEFSSMIRVIPLKGLVSIIKMSAFTGVKQRARLFDRITAEGLMERLLGVLKDACHDLFAPLATACHIEHLSVCSKVVSISAPDNAPICNQIDGNGNCSKREIAKSPKASGSQTQNNLNHTNRSLECLGHCAEILLLITSLNLRPALEAEEMLKNPKTASAAVVRSTLWASQESTLREMLALLLRVACYTLRSSQQQSVSLLKSFITDCVLQISVYSGCLYSMVVSAINALFEDFQCHETRCSSRYLPSRLSSITNSTRSPEYATGCGVNCFGCLESFTPLLPLFVGLLAQTSHAQVHKASIRRWFFHLSEILLPDAFEAPFLISGRKSTVSWGRLLVKRPQPTTKGVVAGYMRPWTANMLSRDLRRSEVISLLPYFTFSCRVIQETSWRDSSEAFFAKIASLSYHIMMANAWQCSLCFGQAFSCYNLVSLTLTEHGMSFLKDTKLEEGSETPKAMPVIETPQTSKNTPNYYFDVKKRSRSVVATEDESLQSFIPSPSHGLISYEALYLDLTDAEFQDCVESNDVVISDSNHNHFVSFPRDVTNSHERIEEPGDVSPQGMLTRPWHLSRRMLLLPNGDLNRDQKDA